MARAACKGKTELFFSDEMGDEAIAKSFCRTCPVFAECAEAGTTEKWGIWAGRAPGDRGVRSPGKRMPVAPKPCKGGCGRIVAAGRVRYCDRCIAAVHGLTIPNMAT